MILPQLANQYIGRFAPSPTGPLHLGSLYTALASFLDARQQDGLWLLRIDDLDTLRNVKGAADSILRCLERFELIWDGEVYYQNQYLDHYQDSLNQLRSQQQIYACRCSRKELIGTTLYPGHCRFANYPADQQAGLRLKTDDRQIAFHDDLQGFISQNLAQEHGDFIIRRRDQIIAYQFAVVIDDHQQGVNHVVRGVDLLDATPKQIYLQQLLGYPEPRYSHLPVIIDLNGQKLSKQTLAAPVDDTSPKKTLYLLLHLLRQNPPVELQNATVAEQLQWAIKHWQPQALKKIRAIQPPIH